MVRFRSFCSVVGSKPQNPSNSRYVQQGRASLHPGVVIMPTCLAKRASGDALISSDGARDYQGDEPTPQAVVGKGVYEGCVPQAALVVVAG